jgi:hypothetical protein
MAAAIFFALYPLIRLLRGNARDTNPIAFVAGGFLAAYVAFLLANATYDLWWDDFHWLLLGTIIGTGRLAEPIIRARAVAVA